MIGIPGGIAPPGIGAGEGRFPLSAASRFTTVSVRIVSGAVPERPQLGQTRDPCGKAAPQCRQGSTDFWGAAMVTVVGRSASRMDAWMAWDISMARV